MANWKSYFTFPVFYTAVFKNNTHLNQYDAVNVLLTGERLTGTDETTFHITPNMTSHYVRGGKPISKEIVGNFLDLSPDERALRIARARMISKKDGSTCLYRLLGSEHILMDEELRQHLFQLYQYDTDAFLDISMHQSISCPRNHLSKLDDNMIADILSYRSANRISDTRKRSTTDRNTDKQSTEDPQTDFNAVKDPDNDMKPDENLQKFPTEIPEQNQLIRKSAISHLFGTSGALCFAQKRLFTISDMETVEKYLTILSELPCMISLDSNDIPAILQNITNCNYACITELHVPMEDLATYLQMSLPSNVVYALLFVEGNIGLTELNGITNTVQDFCGEDASLELYLYYDEDYPDGDFSLHLLTAHHTEIIPPPDDEAEPEKQKSPSGHIVNLMNTDKNPVKKIEIPNFLNNKKKND